MNSNSPSESSEGLRETIDVLLDIDGLNTARPAAAEDSSPQAHLLLHRQEVLSHEKEKTANRGCGESLFQDFDSVGFDDEHRRNIHKRPLAIHEPGTSLAITTKKHHGMISASTVSEDEHELERRRQDRNLREQMRSQQITKQIQSLREVLVAANVPVEKSDKYSTLVTVGEYMRKLQEDSAKLDFEHGRLVKTIDETSKAINSQYIRQEKCPSECVADEALKFKLMFRSCPFPVAVANVDGRFLDANVQFEDLCGYDRSEILPNDSISRHKQEGTRNMSIFSVVVREDMEPLFVAMSTILQRSLIPNSPIDCSDRWQGMVRFCRRLSEMVFMTISLVRGADGQPLFFNCLFLASETNSSAKDGPPIEIMSITTG